MDLLILRHGQAGKSSNSFADYKRSLTSQGRQEVEDLSQGLKSLTIKFDVIFTSPLVRARQTAEIVAKSLRFSGKIQYVDSLKPEGSQLEFYSLLSKLKQDSKILVVGHEPYLSNMISEAISESGCKINLKKAGLAKIKVVSTVPKIKGDLRWLLTPKLLKKIV